MTKTLIHCLAALGLILTACGPIRSTGPATPEPLTKSARTVSPPAAPIETPPPAAAEPVKPMLLTHRREGLDLRRPTIVLHFNKPMDPDSFTRALRIKPALAFTSTWANDNHDLRLTPSEPLAPDLLLDFTLTRLARDAEGEPLASVATWRFRTPDMLGAQQIPELPGPAQPITFQLNYDVQPWSAVRAFSLEPRTAGTTTFDPASRTLTFTPAYTLTAGTTYTWHVDRPLWDVAGDPVLVDAQGSFSTQPLAAFVPSDGKRDASIGEGVTVRFTQPVDRASAETAFSLTPRTAGSFQWEGDRVMVFMPDGGFLEASTSYAVKLDRTVRLLDGRPALNASLGATFATRDPRHLADFGLGLNAQVVDTQGRRGVQFAYDGNTRAVTAAFTLRRVTLTDFVDGVVQQSYGWHETPELTPDLSRYPIAATWAYDGETPAPRRDEYPPDHRLETTLPAEVAPGLYVLELEAAGERDALWVVLTSLALQVRRSEDQLLAWVTDINGRPTPNALVTVYDEDGQALVSGAGNDDGLARLDLPDGQEPAWVTATANGESTLTGLTSGWRSYTPSDTTLVRKATAQAVYITTDRPIYRPGDVIHFKAILRRDDDGVLTAEPDKEVVVQLRDSRSNIVRTIYLRTDAFGAVDSLFRLAEGAMLGQYQIELTVDGEDHRQSLQVEEYHKPEIAVDLSTDTTHYAVGQIIRGAVDSRYFFDAPVANATVTVNLYDVFQACDWFTGDCVDHSWFSRGDSAIRGMTDATGRFVFTTTASSSAVQPYQTESPEPGLVGIEATVDDGSGVPVSAHLLLDVYPSTRQIDWLTHGGLRQPGETVTVSARITDLAGGVVTGQVTRLEVRRWNERSLDYTDVVTQIKLTSDSAGQVSAPVQVSEPGYYQVLLRATDPGGRELIRQDWLWVYAGADAYPHQVAEFAIEADRASYAPGDQAVLTIRSDFSGPALISIGRTGLLREQVVTLQSPVTRVTVPIQAGDTPNLNVTVSAWKPDLDAAGNPQAFEPDAYYSQRESRRVADQVVLLVPPTEKQLTVLVTPDQATYAAGARATFDLSVTDAAGSPAQAQVTLALVDEAIFRLAEDESGPIFDAFHFARAADVADFDSYTPQRWLALMDGGGCGGGGGGDWGSQPRSVFADTAVWEPSIETDAEGHARVTVTLPDNLTTWRLTARAVTVDTRVGEAVTRIVTQQDLIVRPLLPATLTAGDDVDLTVMIHNNTEATRLITVGLLTPAGFELRDPLTQSVQAPAQSAVAVGWRARALEAGDRKLTFWAQDPDDRARRDSIELPLSVKALAVPDVRTQVGEVNGQGTLTVTKPADVLALSRLDLTLSGSIAGNVTDGLDYLTGYPYGCVEQTMSRALPNAVVARAFRELGLSASLEQADLARKIDASLQRLYGFQHDDGGWGWWTDDVTDDYQTAWVIFGLTQTRAAGYQVEPAVIERGAAYLTNQIDALDAHTRAFALYSLALAGQGDLKATQAAARAGARLDVFSQANLTLALHLLGDEVGAREMLARLSAAAHRENGQAYWPGSDQDGHYHEKTMASTTRSTAVALSALVALAPDDPLVGESVRYLMAQRRADGWGSTNETSFTILALTDYLLARERAAQTTRYTVSLNGVEVERGVLNTGQLSTRITVPADALRTGTNVVTIATTDGALFYTATERWSTAVARVSKAGVIDVQRVYTENRGRAPFTLFTAGQIVRVSLTVDLPRRGAFMLIEDIVPAGLQPINERLNTTAHDPALVNYCGWYGNECNFYQWEEYGYNQKEIRDDRVSFFVTSWEPGKHVITYLARAVRTGRFTALPATVSAMYDDTLWGRSDSVGLYVRP